MKHNNFLGMLAMAMLLALPFAFVSCGDDKDDEPEAIQNTETGKYPLFGQYGVWSVEITSETDNVVSLVLACTNKWPVANLNNIQDACKVTCSETVASENLLPIGVQLCPMKNATFTTEGKGYFAVLEFASTGTAKIRISLDGKVMAEYTGRSFSNDSKGYVLDGVRHNL